MLFRTNEWSRGFLLRVYGEDGNVFIGHSWWEQAAMHHLLNDDTSRQHMMAVPSDPVASENAASTWQLTRSHVQYVPQWWINRYIVTVDCYVMAFQVNAWSSPVPCSHPAQLATPSQIVYKPGHFILSFSRCVPLLHNTTRCIELMSAYASAAK